MRQALAEASLNPIGIMIVGDRRPATGRVHERPNWPA